jgi:hypothetical protein
VPLLAAQLVIILQVPGPTVNPYPLRHYRHFNVTLKTATLHPLGLSRQPVGDKIYPDLQARHVVETPFEILHYEIGSQSLVVVFIEYPGIHYLHSEIPSVRRHV